MSLALIQTNQVLVHQGIIAAFGGSPGKFYQDQYVAVADADGIGAALDAVTAPFTTAQLVTNIATNLGLPNDTLLATWLTSLVTTFGKGGALQQLFSAMAAAPAGNAYASTISDFNAKTVASIQHSEVAGSAFSTTVIASASTTSGQTFTLTTGVDNFTGGAGDDSITGADDTLTILDVINGGAGTDTLAIVDDSLTAYTLPIATTTISGIENLTLAHSSNAATDVIVVDVSTLADIDTVVVRNSGTAIGTNGAGGEDGFIITTSANATSVTVDGVSTTAAILDGAITDSGTNGASTTDTLATITLANIGDAALETVAVASEALTTLNLTNVSAIVTNTDTVTTDARTLTVNYGGTNLGVTDAGVQTATVNINTATANAGTNTFGAATTFNLNVNAALTAGTFTTAAATDVNVVVGADVTAATLGAATVETLDISGTADATLTQTAAADAVITNTGSGDLTLVTAIAAGQQFVGGSGVDTVTFAATGTTASTLGAGDDVATFSAVAGTGGSVDAGAGDDTVALTAANAVTLSGATAFEADIANFEKLSVGAIAAAAAASTINLGNLDDINYVVLAGAADNTTGGALTQTISGFSSGGTLELTALLGGATDLRNVAATGSFTGASDTFTLRGTATDGFVNAGAVTLASIETLNIVVDDTDTTAPTAVFDFNFDAAAATTINISGDVGVTLANSGFGVLRTLDASGVTREGAVGAVTATANNGMDTTLTGGAGRDALTGGNADDTISGNGDNDALAGGAGSDVINGGDGVDTITFVFETGDNDVMTGGAGNDIFVSAVTTAATIQVQEITDFDLGTASAAADVLRLSDTALTGLTTTTDLVDTSANSAANGDGTIVHMTADNQTVADADLVVLSGTYADATAALAGMKAAGNDTIVYGAALTDNDSFLVAYTDGTDSYIAVATTAGVTLTNTEGLDSVANIVKLTGISDLTNFNSTDYTTVT